MRFDHIDNFNQACASVSKLAAEAIAEHRRQIALIESIGREAAALAERTLPELPRPDRKTTPLPPPSPETSRELGQAVAEQGRNDQSVAAPTDDILGLAMRRAEQEPSFRIGEEDLPMFERTSANDFGDGSGIVTDRSARGTETSKGDHDRGGFVAALSGRKRARRLASS